MIFSLPNVCYMHMAAGLGVLLGAVGLVGLATAGVLNTGSGETLATVSLNMNLHMLRRTC